MTTSARHNDIYIPNQEDCDRMDDGSGGSDDVFHDADTSSNAAAKEDEKEPEIAKQESKDVFRLKFVVLVVLVCSATLAATFVYVYLKNGEEEKYITKFEDDAHKVLDAIGRSLDRTLGAFDGLSVALVSTAHMTNQTWPFVTIEDHAVRMAKLLPFTDAINIAIVPVVTPENKAKWEAYSVANDYWVNENMRVQEDWGRYFGPIVYNGSHNGVVHSDYGDIPDNVSRIMLPTWQNFPVIANTSYTYGWDWLSSLLPDAFATCVEKHKAVISAPYMIPPEDDLEQVEATKIWAEFYRNFIGQSEEAMAPMSDFVYPIVDEVSRVWVAGDENYDVAQHNARGMITATVYWRALIRNILPDGDHGIVVVFENACTDPFTYEVKGIEAVYLGVGDKHNTKYNRHGISSKLSELRKFAVRESAYTGAMLDEDSCPFTIHAYPSDHMQAALLTTNPVMYAAIVVLIFAFVSIVFCTYDMKVERRQSMVMNAAVRSSAIVSSLFPSEVRDRIYPESEGAKLVESNKQNGKPFGFAKGNANKFTKDIASAQANRSESLTGRPIAELYPETTVLFADICGFTSWSSERSPTQVFELLETLYAAFDAIAKRRGVFKVETIGDCYVAAVGLPTPRKQHAVVMARFAADCRAAMSGLLYPLEKTLGVGTADLAIRIGLNSGPTTAGVLRGEKSRFQLFGDTVNTAARMESNGKRNKIQVSQKTADLIRQAGKGHWLSKRDERVDCKGKGLLTVYWCEPSSSTSTVISGSDDSISEQEAKPMDEHDRDFAKTERLIDWNVDVLTGMLKKVIMSQSGVESDQIQSDLALVVVGRPIDEISAELALPTVIASTGTTSIENEMISAAVLSQLRELVESIASLYQQHAFHNFEHASHVAMSTVKLLDRMAECNKTTDGDTNNSNAPGSIYGPLSRFAVVFAAMIHDIEHCGVSNAQLVQEQHPLAIAYAGRSVAEQHSVDTAWQTFMKPQFADLRRSLFANQLELQHFRAVVVNAVMATDLFDPELKVMRETRWNKSLASDPVQHDSGDVSKSRAAIVLDLLIQASDVSHTMQHFTIYKKWNLCLLTEMYEAYQNGRSAKDPTIGWYDGELWFFDSYVIPLAQKLRGCQVFGVSCDEFLDYAQDNRAEWEVKGRVIVAQAKADLQAKVVQQGMGESVAI